MTASAPVIIAIAVITAVQLTTTFTRAEQRACDEKLVHGLLGQPYSDDLAENARRMSGAASVMPSGPGIPSSADAREDRLNVLLDARRIVVGFRCG